MNLLLYDLCSHGGLISICFRPARHATVMLTDIITVSYDSVRMQANGY